MVVVLLLLLVVLAVAVGVWSMTSTLHGRDFRDKENDEGGEEVLLLLLGDADDDDDDGLRGGERIPGTAAGREEVGCLVSQGKYLLTTASAATGS